MESVENQSLGASSGNRRRRARKACIPCRHRKRKCDGSTPCEMCSAYGYNCQYGEEDGPLAPYVAQPRTKRTQTQQNGDYGSQANQQVISPSSFSNIGSPSSATSPKRRRRSTSLAAGAAILDEKKARYVGDSSSIGFPRSLGLELRSLNPPPLHSFGYNFGIRAEEQSVIRGSVADIISEVDSAIYSNIFFSTIAPVYDILDQKIYERRRLGYYNGSIRDAAFGAVIAGVVAFGSFMSTNSGHSRESDLAQYAKIVLEDPTCTRRPAIDQVVGWILRTAYLRATTRPNCAWLASSTVSHLLEALGMHLEENIVTLSSGDDAVARGHDAERLRRIFWLGWTNNVITSYEYGRSPVQFECVTCENVTPSAGTYAHQQIHLAQIIPSPNSPYTPGIEATGVKEDIYQRIKSCGEYPTDHPFTILTRADLVFCFYRRLRRQRISVDSEVVDLIISVGNKAVEAATRYVSEGRPFWNVLGSCFQFTCVLLAIDTHASLANITTAIRGLETIVNAADTRLTREALTTARVLLKDTINKKRQELSMLETANEYLPHEDETSLRKAAETLDLPTDLDFNLNWDTFFNESYQTWLGQNEMMGHSTWTIGTQQLPQQP